MTVSEAGSLVEYTLPFVLQRYDAWSNLVVVDGYMHALSTDGVWRSSDLLNWKKVWTPLPGVDPNVRTAFGIKTLNAWGDDLVISTSGASAAIISRPASPEDAQQQMMRDAILDEVVEGSYTLRQMMRLVAAAMAGVSSGGGTSAVTFTGLDGSTPRIVATVDANGNRTAVTKTVT